MCFGCGRTDCDNPKSADEVREHLRQVIELGRTIGIPDDLVDHMAEKLDSVPDEILQELYRAVAEATLGSRGEEFFNTGDLTTFLIDRDGKIRRQRTGKETKTIALKDIEGVNPAVIEAFEAFGKLSQEISDKRQKAEQLRNKAKQLQKDAQGRRVDLKFDISAILPDKHAHYFGQNLRLTEENGRILLLDENSNIINVVAEAVGRPLLNRRRQIETDEQKAQQNHDQANRLEREAQTLPELLERKHQVASALFRQHVVDKLKGDGVIRIRPFWDPETRAYAKVTRLINEEGEEVPAEEMDLLKAMARLDASRNGVEALPPGLRDLLGLPAEETPQLEQTLAEAAAAVRTGAEQGLTTGEQESKLQVDENVAEEAAAGATT